VAIGPGPARRQPERPAVPDAWVPAYVGIGSNLDGPAAHVARAVTELAALPDTRLVMASRLVRNPPLGGSGQPDYVNAVAALLTRLTPAALLEKLHGLERDHGRHRAAGEHWAPRTLDLDLLVFGEVRLESAHLTIPHPGIRARNFVLFPLLDIAPGLRVPGLGSVGRLARELDRTGLDPVDWP
jgi:2-amino-4-hydroxy-6-hydroxymethyldihydropteridine diphosphokinase